MKARSRKNVRVTRISKQRSSSYWDHSYPQQSFISQIISSNELHQNKQSSSFNSVTNDTNKNNVHRSQSEIMSNQTFSQGIAKQNATHSSVIQPSFDTSITDRTAKHKISRHENSYLSSSTLTNQTKKTNSNEWNFDVSERRQLHRKPARNLKKENGLRICPLPPWICLLLGLLLALLLAGIAAALVATLLPTKTTTTVSTTAATTTTTTSMNLCLANLLSWNTTGITLLNSSILTNPSGLYVSSDDTLYIVDERSNHVIWRLPNNTQTPTLLLGQLALSGSASNQFWNPQDVYVDANGNIYVSDHYNHRIQKFTSGSTIGSTLAGISGSLGSSLNSLSGPRYIAMDATETTLYVTDSNNHRILSFPVSSTSGNFGTVVAGGNGGGNTVNQLNIPWGIHHFPSVSSDLYITNMNSHTVMKWTPGASSGSVVAGTSGTSGSNATLLNSPMGIRVDKYLNFYVVDQSNHRIQMFCHGSNVGVTIAGTGSSGNSATELNRPRGIAFDSAMNLYVADFTNLRVQKFMKL